MQSRGYCAMSFQDIADAVGIKKPSIIYHFPDKEALALAVIHRYHTTFQQALKDAQADAANTPWEVLNVYYSPYRAFAKTKNRICLCAALAGEFEALPKKMQTQVRKFFNWHEVWLTELLEQGMADGAFTFSGDAAELAKSIFASLQGTLMIMRAQGSARQLEDQIGYIKRGLGA